MMRHMPAIPEPTRSSIIVRLLDHAEKNWPQLAKVRARYHGSFAYITGVLRNGEQIPLFRLRYGGSAHSFGFAIYSAALEHPGFGGDSILPRCSGLGGRCLPRYRRLAEPRSDHFPLCFIEHLSNCAVQLPRLVAGSARQAPPAGPGHLLVGHPALRRGFPGLGKGDAQRHRLRRRRRP